MGKKNQVHSQTKEVMQLIVREAEELSGYEIKTCEGVAAYRATIDVGPPRSIDKKAMPDHTGVHPLAFF